MKRVTIFGALLLLVTSCSSVDYVKTESSVAVMQGDTQIELTVMSDDIIRVKKRLVSSAEEIIPEYVVTMLPQKVDWRVKTRGGNLVVETPALTATLNEQGEVSFAKKCGKALTSEIAEGSYIKPNSATDNATAQAFSSENEAIYGLGQFQNGLINWRNTPMLLLQSNQEIAVPFIISTAGYGIYWSNYSVTSFNLPESELKCTEVVDKENNIKSGKFTPRKSGTHYFMIESETSKKKNRRLGAMRLIIDRDTVINYETMWFPDAMSGRADLEAGREYDITFEDKGAQCEVSRVLYNEPDYNRTTFSNKHGESVDYYFIGGETPAQVADAYSSLTGRAPMLPKSALGFWQCREAYKTQEHLLENAREYRKRKIPVDNIVQDWDYWPKNTRGPEWERTRYPNPAEMVKQLDDLNLNLMVSVWPAVNNEPIVKRYKLDKFEKNSYINAYDPAVADRFYEMLSDSMYKIGVQAIWVDGSEPVHSPEPTTATGVGEFQQLTNIYSQRVLRGVYEGHRKEFPSKRVLNLTRSGYCGQQRFGAMVWSGDVDGSWEQFREQIPAGLNIAMAGIPYWTTDIGGFFRNMIHCNTEDQDQYNSDNYKELLSRWFEYGTFCPIFRIHGFRSETEVWRFGKEFEALARKYIDLRYQLMPYIYSTSRKVTTDGAVFMSPLAYQFPEDKNVWNISDQFLFGESLLISPVVEYKARTRKMYLPEGVWYNFWSGEAQEGGREIVASAELDEMPIFVKAGSIIPFGAKVQYATEPTTEPIEIRVYAGADGDFTLYLDDNTSYDYEQGIYSEVVMRYSEKSGEITLSSGVDKFAEFAKNPMTFVVTRHGSEAQKSIVFNGTTQSIKL